MRGRELKYHIGPQRYPRVVFALMRGRELKCICALPIFSYVLVRPHARAGVEMCMRFSRFRVCTVRPHARAGVEIHNTLNCEGLEDVRPHARAGVEIGTMINIPVPEVNVRPHARAGVEISSRRRRSPATLFALTRGRELNVPMASSITSCCSSPLTRRRRGCEGMRRRGAPFRGGMWLRVIGRFRLLGHPLQSLLLLPLVLLIFWPPTGRCRRLACVGAEPRA